MIPEYALMGMSIITFLLSAYAVINLISLKGDVESKVKRVQESRDRSNDRICELELILGSYSAIREFPYYKDKCVMKVLDTLIDELG